MGPREGREGEAEGRKGKAGREARRTRRRGRSRRRTGSAGGRPVHRRRRRARRRVGRTRTVAIVAAEEALCDCKQSAVSGAGMERGMIEGSHRSLQSTSVSLRGANDGRTNFTYHGCPPARRNCRQRPDSLREGVRTLPTAESGLLRARLRQFCAPSVVQRVCFSLGRVRVHDSLQVLSCVLPLLLKCES